MLFVTSIERSSRALTINWNEDGKHGTSCFYRHADGAWHPDPDTKKKGKNYLRQLHKAYALWLRKKAAEIRVTQLRQYKRMIVIGWKTADEQGVTHLYHHQDGSWHTDPETMARGMNFLTILMTACYLYKNEPMKETASIRVWFAD